MARKVLNRKELRRESEAAEGAEAAAKTKPEKKAPAKRKSRAKATQEVRLKAYWGVFNQSLKRIALFEKRVGQCRDGGSARRASGLA